MAFELREGVYIYVNDKPLVFPSDADFRPASVLFGLNPDLAQPCIPIKVDADGKLIIDLDASEITIGAVEIKDDIGLQRLNIVYNGYPTSSPTNGITIYGVDDSTATMEPLHFDSTGNLKVVVSNTSSLNSSFFMSDYKPDVAGGTAYTILTYTNSGSILWLDGWTASGTSLGKYSLFLNTNRKMVLRSGSAHSVQYTFPTPQKIAIGDIIDIKILHGMPMGNFDATLIGHR